jgi:hypothetical protein
MQLIMKEPFMKFCNTVSKIKITVLFFKNSALNYIVKCTVLEEKYNHGKNKRYFNELMMFA